MNTSHIIYTPQPEATPESEAAALAAVYRFILDCHAKKKASLPSIGGDGKKTKNVPANPIVPQRQ